MIFDSGLLLGATL